MANNKVQLSDGTTLMDLTQDTVTPQTLLAGATAHNAAGEQIVGEATSGGMTQEEADARYLQLSGGTLTGDLTLEAYPKQAEDGGTYGQFKVMLDTPVDGYNPFPLLCYSGEDLALFLLGEPNENDASAGDMPQAVPRIDCNGVQFINAGSQAMVLNSVNEFYLPTMYDVKEYVGTKGHKVTLTVAGWDSGTKKQVVNCADVAADETAQQILPMPAAASMTAYNDAGIQCVAQAASKLTFQCDTVPTSSIDVYVTITPVAFS